MKGILLSLAVLVISGTAHAQSEGGGANSGGTPPTYGHVWFPDPPPVDVTCAADQYPVYDYGWHKWVCEHNFCGGGGEGGGNGCGTPPTYGHVWFPQPPPVDVTCPAGQVPVYDWGYKAWTCLPYHDPVGNG